MLTHVNAALRLRLFWGRGTEAPKSHCCGPEWPLLVLLVLGQGSGPRWGTPRPARCLAPSRFGLT
jgi:hypothetical protein